MADEHERGDEEKLDEIEERMEDLDVPAEESEELTGGGAVRRAPSE
jgi:hypothetical protein